jgi:hypothetical protein
MMRRMTSDEGSGDAGEQVDELEERWIDLGKLLSRSAPELMAEAVIFFENLAVAIIDRSPSSEAGDAPA